MGDYVELVNCSVSRKLRFLRMRAESSLLEEMLIAYFLTVFSRLRMRYAPVFANA